MAEPSLLEKLEKEIAEKRRELAKEKAKLKSSQQAAESSEEKLLRIRHNTAKNSLHVIYRTYVGALLRCPLRICGRESPQCRAVGSELMTGTSR